MLLADDVVLLAETVIGLQSQLDSLCSAASSLQLKVNLDKCNIIVFRKGGYLGARERWFYNGLAMPVVNVYKYLGIYFSTRLSFSFACKDLSSRAKQAAVCIMQNLSTLGNQSFSVLMKLFDSQVQPIVLYGAEIWGLEKAAVSCERVHLFVLKKFLGVSLKTPNDLIYGETNRFPIYLNSAIKCFRYWIKLLHMDLNRLPKKAYNMLCVLDGRGNKNWVTNVRVKLQELGFGHVWLYQGVGDVSMFLRIVRARLIECRWEDWGAHIRDSDRFDLYGQFNAPHYIPIYLTMNLDSHLKFIMTRFRFGISDIKVHHLRYKQHSDDQLVCPLCKTERENEVHFVLRCPAFCQLRNNLIPKKYYREPCMFRLVMLLASTNEQTVKKLALYLYKPFRIRTAMCS